jgi:hypothetical protein
VFVTETRCPFCQHALASLSRAPIFDIRAGMSRAQRYTLVAAVAGQTLLGCSNNDAKSGAQGGSGGMQQQGSGGVAMQGTGGGQPIAGNGGGIAQPVYGAPFNPGTGGQGTGGANTSGGSGGQALPVPHYGGAVPPPDMDAGRDAGRDASADAGDASAADAGRDAGRIQPLYGAPAAVYGAPIPNK